jgi:hypothetical protein
MSHNKGMVLLRSTVRKWSVIAVGNLDIHQFPGDDCPGAISLGVRQERDAIARDFFLPMHA